MKITEIRDEENATVETEAGAQQINISMVADAAVDDYVIVHAGFAIEKLDEDDARERIDMFEELAGSME